MKTLQVKSQEPLFTKTDETSHFYFDHSYHMVCNGDEASSSCTYGNNLVASVQTGNIFGVQFHPEKSADVGEQLLKNFLEKCE